MVSRQIIEDSGNTVSQLLQIVAQKALELSTGAYSVTLVRIDSERSRSI